ncbi:hypothetical protein L596_016915 [Steinernema carpocapsae]|uniref:C-type lectin domain-containing protein n=1 Tax=Steinernema carpocapsae TaxID=34508 RepID=A0A4V6A3I8_STECR|nr:hypothetical protein L596_016915 [Steinernema carpocapsae]
MLTLILASLAILALGDNGCPAGSFSSFNGDKCFHVVELEATFRKAESICVNFGGHLASIHNKYDNTFVEENVSGDFWLGGTDQSSNDVWNWTDGSHFDYFKWAAGGPFHQLYDDCILVDKLSGLWQGKHCNKQAYFVCETSSTTSGPQSCSTPKPVYCPTCTCPTIPWIPPVITERPHTQCSLQTFCDGGYEYRYFPQQLTWATARLTCQSLGGDLASIHNTHVFAFIDEMLLQAHQYLAWIGGQVDSSGQISWIDGSRVDFLHWATNNPHHRTMVTCAVARRVKGWENIDCDYKKRFICEIPLS